MGSVFLSPEISPAQAERLRARDAPVNCFPDGSTRVSASWLIREAGFGLRCPVTTGVRVSPLHYTLVAENPADGASAARFSTAVEIVRRRVEGRTALPRDRLPRRLAQPTGNLSINSLYTRRV
ncbi:hypothetical protein [Streptomyces sp. NPDC003032]